MANCRKYQFESRFDAIAVLREMITDKLIDVIPGMKLIVYKCEVCHGYHFGHQLKQLKTEPRKSRQGKDSGSWLNN